MGADKCLRPLIIDEGSAEVFHDTGNLTGKRATELYINFSDGAHHGRVDDFSWRRVVYL